jgi:hypothetical protein
MGVNTFTRHCRAFFCIPPLPFHNTIDWLNCIKKENNSTNEPFPGIGGIIFTLDELRAHSELPPTLSQMLIYAYYFYYWIENTLRFLKLFELCL